MNFDQYQNNGFYFPIKAIPKNKAINLCKELETIVTKNKIHKTIIYRNANYLVPSIYKITKSKNILNCISKLIGNNIYVLEAVIFAKEPKTNDFISWHQDLTYWGFDSDQVVTAWVSLTESNKDNGCMHFISGSHKDGIVAHKKTYKKNNMLSRGQVIKENIDESKSVIVKLNQGEMSLHNGKLFHSSGKNQSNIRRIGLAIRYISSDMKHESGYRIYSHHVSGEKNTDHFISTQPPKITFSTEDLKIVNLKNNILKKTYNKYI